MSNQWRSPQAKPAKPGRKSRNRSSAAQPPKPTMSHQNTIMTPSPPPVQAISAEQKNRNTIRGSLPQASVNKIEKLRLHSSCNGTMKLIIVAYGKVMDLKSRPPPHPEFRQPIIVVNIDLVKNFLELCMASDAFLTAAAASKPDNQKVFSVNAVCFHINALSNLAWDVNQKLTSPGAILTTIRISIAKSFEILNRHGLLNESGGEVKNRLDTVPMPPRTRDWSICTPVTALEHYKNPSKISLTDDDTRILNKSFNYSSLVEKWPLVKDHIWTSHWFHMLALINKWCLKAGTDTKKYIEPAADATVCLAEAQRVAIERKLSSEPGFSMFVDELSKYAYNLYKVWWDAWTETTASKTLDEEKGEASRRQNRVLLKIKQCMNYLETQGLNDTAEYKELERASSLLSTNSLELVGVTVLALRPRNV